MHPNETAINDYVDESLDPRERADLERHLESCGDCRALVEDLREIVHATRSLDVHEPPARAWSRIERAIRLEAGRGDEARGFQGADGAPGFQGADGARGFQGADGARGFQPSGGGDTSDARLKGSRSTSRRSVSRRYAWIVAVAAVLVLTTAVGLRLSPWRRPVPAPDARPGTAAGVTAGDPAQSIETELLQAENHYEKAIKGLEQIASADQGTLDPRTAATLQKNLAVVDQAISESRAAVRSEPASDPAQQSLIENFKTKIGLLQDTVALINEMRKGNEAGAARIASGLKQKGD